MNPRIAANQLRYSQPLRVLSNRAFTITNQTNNACKLLQRNSGTISTVDVLYQRNKPLSLLPTISPFVFLQHTKFISFSSLFSIQLRTSSRTRLNGNHSSATFYPSTVQTSSSSSAVAHVTTSLPLQRLTATSKHIFPLNPLPPRTHLSR